MLKATLRSLMSHKLRLMMTALAIVLGVSFISGTYVLSDSITSAFDDLFSNAYSGVDVSIRGVQAFDDFEADERPTIPDSLLEEIRGVDSVALAEGGVTGTAIIVGADGEAIVPQGPPTLGFSWGDVDDLNPLSIRDGAPPTTPDEVAIDARTAEDQGFEVGDTVKILAEGPAQEFTLSGVVGFGEVDNLAGATIAVFEKTTAQELFDKVGEFDSIEVVGESGTTQTEVKRNIIAAIGTDYDVSTGADITQQSSDDIAEGLGFLSTALLAFGFIALFVGSFIIANTFSIVVAQRTRELALMRALGATRRQVMTSILLEALLTGVVASAIGVGVGILVAIGLQSLLKAFGIDLPTGPLVIGPKAVIVPMVAGVLVTVGSAFSPARRATKVPPVAAMRDDFTVSTQAGRRRIIAGTVALILGATVLLVGLFIGGDSALQQVGLGALLTFVGVAAIAPVLATPLSRFLGSPFARFFHVPGRIARDNSMRNPKRTSSTAAALMIGVALVGFITIFASSLKASQLDLIQGSTNFNFIVQGKGFYGFDPKVEDAVRDVPEVEAVAGFRVGPSLIEGSTVQVSGVDIVPGARVLNFDMLSGDSASIATTGILVADDEAEAHGWSVGDEVKMQFQATPERVEEIKGIYQRNPLAGDYVMGLPDFESSFTDAKEQVVLILTQDGVSESQGRAAVEKALEVFPDVEVQNQDEFIEATGKQIDQLLGLVSALLGLALIIAFIGIVNTLALSIFERTREIGLLRAIGMSRGQVKRMIRWEAVIISMLGAVLGLGIGIFFGWAMVAALKDEGFGTFRLPLLTLIGYVFIAGIAGVGAAVFPARRAAKLDVLRAITTE